MSTPTPDAPQPPSTLWLKVACAALAVLVLVLSWRLNQLNQQISRLAPASGPMAALWAEGDTLPPMTMQTPDGRIQRFDPASGGSPRLILLTAPGCPACAEAGPLWNSILENLPPTERDRALLIQPPSGASIDDPASRAVRAPRFTLVERDAALLQRLPLVPATVVVDGQGRIIRLWAGQLAADQTNDVFEALGR